MTVVTFVNFENIYQTKQFYLSDRIEMVNEIIYDIKVKY